MKSRFLGLLAMALVSCGMPAGAVVVFDQQAPGNTGGLFANGSSYLTRTSFELSDSYAITGVNWWGHAYLCNQSGCSDGATTANTNWNLTFFASDGTNPTSTVIHAESFSGLPQVNGYGSYQYDLVSPVVLNANTRYFLAIQSTGYQNYTYWAWVNLLSSSTPAGSRYCQNSNCYDGALAFQLEGYSAPPPAPVPEPAALALLGLGLMGLGLTRRR